MVFLDSLTQCKPSNFGRHLLRSRLVFKAEFGRVVVWKVVCTGGDSLTSAPHTICRTLSRRTVALIFSRSGCPRINDSANLVACFKLTFGGIGGSYGSTTASTSTGPGVFNACSTTRPQS